MKIEKCIFYIEDVSFLRFLLTTHGVKIEPSRVSTIGEWPKSTIFHKIRMFLGFASFCIQFIIGFSKIV